MNITDDANLIMLVTLVGFAFLATILLVPVYLFLKKEEVKGEEINEAIRKAKEQRADKK